jgi:hypothetical protein
MELDHICLYYIGYNKDLARGIRPDYLEERCKDCSIDRQSSILCPYYINIKHMKAFQGLRL